VDSSPQKREPVKSVLNDPFLQLFLAQRQSALMLVDALERALGITPTTAEIRQWYKSSHAEKPGIGYNRIEP
jgi:hypothetical protein